MTSKHEKTRAGKKLKKIYATPCLTRLGAITELTSGGAGSKSETKSLHPPNQQVFP